MNKLLAYHDVTSDVCDLHCQRKHIQLTHDLQDQFGIHPSKFQKVEKVRGVTIDKNNKIDIKKN